MGVVWRKLAAANVGWAEGRHSSRLGRCGGSGWDSLVLDTVSKHRFHATGAAGGPSNALRVFRKVVGLMAEGKPVTLLPEDRAVTTQRAADLLGMSRPFFVRLLEGGVMAHHRLGNQRRVYLRDVLEFSRKRDEERQASLDRLSRRV